METEQQQINDLLADGSLYTTDPKRAIELNTRHAAIEEALMLALERWEALSR